MKRSRIAATLLVLSIAVSGSAASDLAGLWKAKKRFGPDARGTLTFQHTDLGGGLVGNSLQLGAQAIFF